VVVKRLSNVDATKIEFQQQLELIRGVGKHQNVATLHAFYYSTDEKLLLYDYYAAGSLMALLHGTYISLFDVWIYVLQLITIVVFYNHDKLIITSLVLEKSMNRVCFFSYLSI
jgi:serine/threonine protein kinase